MASAVPVSRKLEATVGGRQVQLSIFVRAGDVAGGRPLYREIMDRARAAGLAGATAVRGLQGFGNSARLAPPGLFHRNGSEPVLIELVDDDARVRAFLPVLDQLVSGGLVVLKPVTSALIKQASADAEQPEVGGNRRLAGKRRDVTA